MGNILYLALRAHASQTRGRSYRVLDHFGDSEWRRAFPRLEKLFIPVDDVRFADRRDHLTESFYQGYGTDFTAQQLDAFVRDVLLDADLEEIASRASHSPFTDEVVVNVRRGDYYSNPEFKAVFGFDVARYVDAAWTRLLDTSSPTSVAVVSDDPVWCRENLRLPGLDPSRVRYVGPSDGVLTSFATVARCPRIILTNSTFSYWAAYVSESLHGAGTSVWAPDFHARHVDGGRPWQHADDWFRVPAPE